MTHTKKRKIIDLYRDGMSLDCLWTVAGCKTRDEALEVIKEYRWAYWRKTGKRI